MHVNSRCPACRLHKLVATLAIVGCAGVTWSCRPNERPADGPPDWSREAVWYQIFVERFDNGDPTNDPTLADIRGSWPHVSPDGWRTKEWTSDWHGRDDWEVRTAGDFYYTVQLRRYGGDLQGVIDRLDHIASLGVNAVYLNPINDAPSLHKFDARNYRHVDRNFGPNPEGDAATMATELPDDPSTWKWTSADSLFLDFIRRAHDRGIRVIVDYSWNHTGLEHWAFRDVVERQGASPYADWYRIGAFDDPATPENEFSYQGWAGVRELPEFSKSVADGDYSRRPLEGDLHPGPKKLAFDVTARWLDPNGDGDPSDGIDGFRLDVAEMVPLGFWRDYRRHVKSINPDAYLVGEVWWEHWPHTMMDPRPWLGDVFDAVMNYRWYMPTRSMVTGALPEVPPSQYRAHLDSVESDIPRATLEAMMNVAASHDSPRLATSLANAGRYKQGVAWRDNPTYHFGRPDARTRDLQRVLLVQQYTYYGGPHIWAGDELGMWGGDDPDNRKPIWWPEKTFAPESPAGTSLAAMRAGDLVAEPVSADLELLEFYRELGRLRSENSAVLSRGDFKMLFSHDESRTLGYERRLGDRRMFVFLNAGDSALQVELSDFGVSSPGLLLSSRSGHVEGTQLTVAGRSAVVLGETGRR